MINSFSMCGALILLLLTSCTGDGTSHKQSQDATNTTVTEAREEQPKQYDGSYCARVRYYNPNTGTRSQYRLIIEAEDNELTRINFREGHLDDDHFRRKAFDEEGSTSITTDRGYEYTVSIVGHADGCFEGMTE